MQLSFDDVELRVFNQSDSFNLAKLCNNRKIWDNLRDFIPHPYLEVNAIEFINLCSNESPQLTFAIEYLGDLVGTIGLVRQNDIYRMSAELGYWIGEEYWGKGIATKAVKLICNYGFQKLGLVRIYSGVFDFNLASQKVLLKSGFKLEGVFEKSVIKNNVFINEFRYGIVNL